MKCLLSFLTVVVLVACLDSTSDGQGHNRQPVESVTELPVVVLGGQTCPDFVQGLQSAGVSKVRDLSREGLAGKASALHAASVAVILVDATEGPLPTNREDILLSRQFCRGKIMVGFSRSALVEDAELIDLEVIELRDLLNKYDFPGDTAVVGFDSESARTKLPKGYSAIADLIAKMSATASSAPSQPVQNVTAGLYVLADMEAFKRGIARPVGSGSYQLIFGEQVLEARIQANEPVQPSNSGSVTLTFSEPVSLTAGARFVIGMENHVLAAGFMPPNR